MITWSSRDHCSLMIVTEECVDGKNFDLDVK